MFDGIYEVSEDKSAAVRVQLALLGACSLSCQEEARSSMAGNAGATLARRLAEAASRVFGTMLNATTDRSGRKLLAKPLIGDVVASYYGQSITKLDPLYEDPLEKRRKIKLERLKRRGKGPPKKGQGKRAAKR